MKVAVELSGQQRYGPHFIELVQQLSIFDEVDLYIHHWDTPRSLTDFVQYVDPLLAPNMRIRKASFEPQKHFDVPGDWVLLHPEGSSIFNLMSMTYSVMKCSELRVLDDAKHDLVIRVRPDLSLKGFPTDQSVFETLAEDQICVGTRPYYLPPKALEMQDQVAIGREATMQKYGLLFENLVQFHAEGNKFHPETVFYWWNVKKSSVRLLEDYFSPQIYNGTMKREHRSLY